jgi:hypothetical protein
MELNEKKKREGSGSGRGRGQKKGEKKEEKRGRVGGWVEKEKLNRRDSECFISRAGTSV